MLFNRFQQHFHENVSNHLTLVIDDLGNLGRSKNSEKDVLQRVYFLNKLPTMDLADGYVYSQHYPRVCEFDGDWPLTRRLSFSKFLPFFHLLQLEWKTKRKEVINLRFVNVFNNVLRNTTSVLEICKIMRRHLKNDGTCHATQSSFSRSKIVCMKERKHKKPLTLFQRFSSVF